MMLRSWWPFITPRTVDAALFYQGNVFDSAALPLNKADKAAASIRVRPTEAE